ncbi:MAG TPA: formyltransferase [Burkholderiales bacterium]|nr:formyltransferase [Burkholderiales bacterium]
MTTALVFAYHDVGVRCLQVLLDGGVEIPLVVTHTDSASENIWFGSVAELARSRGIPVVTPEDANTSSQVMAAAGERPDFVFSFYYRNMLKQPLLDAARLGALNMHGSLLPKYRGRAPVNWAVIRGEKKTGATLHYMEARPDTGDIVDQEAVAILPDDTATDVFNKVTSAAGNVMQRSLGPLIAGTAPRKAQDPALASYFGRRTPEDGRIDWREPAAQVHDLVRGVAPPYPGALTTIAGEPARVLRTSMETGAGPHARPCIYVRDGQCFAQCGDGRVLRILELEWRGQTFDGRRVPDALRGNPLPLTPEPAETQ